MAVHRFAYPLGFFHLMGIEEHEVLLTEDVLELDHGYSAGTVAVDKSAQESGQRPLV